MNTMNTINLIKKGLKDKLVEMAIEDRLPLDITELDIDTIIDEILDSENGKEAQEFDTFCTLVSEEDLTEAWERYQNAEDDTQMNEVVQLVEHMEDYGMWTVDQFHNHFIV